MQTSVTRCTGLYFQGFVTFLSFRLLARLGLALEGSDLPVTQHPLASHPRTGPAPQPHWAYGHGETLSPGLSPARAQEIVTVIIPNGPTRGITPVYRIRVLPLKTEI